VSWHVRTSYANKYFFWGSRLRRYSILRREVFLLGSAASAILSTGDYRDPLLFACRSG